MTALTGLRRLWRRNGRQMLPAQEAYALWADTYPPWPHNPLMQAEHAIVAPLINSVRPGRALDVGTGTGRLIPLLRAAGAELAIGLDLSLPMLHFRTCAAARVCADAYSLPFARGAFDLVCSSLMAGDVADLGRWIAEAARVLAPGGHLIYSDFHQAWAREGWRRIFRTSNGQEVELPYFSHTIDEHLARLEESSLRVRAIREPRLPGRATPVVAVFHAVKPWHGGSP
jgi:malonyl-CoA O-methyltransferase